MAISNHHSEGEGADASVRACHDVGADRTLDAGELEAMHRVLQAAETADKMVHLVINNKAIADGLRKLLENVLGLPKYAWR